MIKASRFTTHRLLVNDAVVMSKSWEVCVTSAMKPACWPIMAGAPSVVTDTSLSNGTFPPHKEPLHSIVDVNSPCDCLQGQYCQQLCEMSEWR